jgi:hypothetical protein
MEANCANPSSTPPMKCIAEAAGTVVITLGHDAPVWENHPVVASVPVISFGVMSGVIGFPHVGSTSVEADEHPGPTSRRFLNLESLVLVFKLSRNPLERTRLESAIDGFILIVLLRDLGFRDHGWRRDENASRSGSQANRAFLKSQCAPIQVLGQIEWCGGFFCLLKVRIRTTLLARMIPNPRTASAQIRHMIIDCLLDPRRRFIQRDSLRFLHLVDLRDDELIRDLITDLSSYELFLKPNTYPQKYQFVMRYDDNELLIHITLSPVETVPPRVKISVHRHNIPGPPLPLIPIQLQP